MTTFFSIIIFLIILFFYIHITAHYKKSEDLEIYEADYSTNKQLQEICDIKQPVLFDFKTLFPDLFQKDNLEIIHQKSEKTPYEIHIKDITDIRTNNDIAGDSVLLPFRSGYGLIETDSKSKYFSENNEEFITNTIEPEMRTLDEFLKPNFTIQSKYDILIGSDKSYTACRYHNNYRKFLFVKNGKIQVKMTPWKSAKYLYPENDYVNYEFRSPIDIWNPQDRYKNEMENLKFLEFEVMEGFILYIPPFWFYSIRFLNSSSPTFVESYTYNSIMNIASNLNHWALYFLQQSNTTNKVLKKKELTNNDEDNITEPESNHSIPESS